ncbi:acetyl-CoA synthetase-like protein [Annulohypoxylon maeteangense]|uniref:acetyl-CoA synthetase-like protein n=1 Tax=Annulohypoxylon maeteangense TaxID=1927788 RepID=UPI00200776F3|nr:acetyl-CoA synthetase-like protein [Annulohypoxylon maeteangense]KAI0888102.1 acetyl-CoA synthetase-like protein [Annulohypoxylon maeteangense]
MGSISDNEYIAIVVQAMSTVLGVSTDEINCTANTTTFVKLGGDSLSAILISAECQKRGLLIPAGILLRISTVKDVIRKAASLARPLSTSSHLPSLTPFSGAGIVPDIAVPTGAGTRLYEPLLVHTITAEPNPDTIIKPSCRSGRDIISANSLLDSINTTEWTEPQLLLLRETSHNQKLNILTLYESYEGSLDVQDVYNAWVNTILEEPIFKDPLRDLEIAPQQLLLPSIVEVETEDDYRREIVNAVKASGPISTLTVIHSPQCLRSDEISKPIVVVWRIHHAFLDGYSARILRDKIGRNLRGEMGVVAGPSFKETVGSLRTLREERRESTRYFWDRKREQFPAAIGEIRLSPQRVTKTTEKFPQERIAIQFPDDKLLAVKRRTGYTTTVYFAAAWALTLSKFMDVDQVYFGTVLSGRDLPIPGACDVVGPLINILPLFVKVPARGDNTSVETFLRSIHDGILELNNVQHSETTEGFNRQFHSIMATQFECDMEVGSLKSIPVDRNHLDMQSGIPINLVIEQEFRIQLFYSTAHYVEEDMNNVRSVFQKSMDCLLQGDVDKQLVSSVYGDLLPRKIEEKIRHWSNCTSPETFDESKGDDLVTLFENVVARHPRDVAIVHGEDGEVSYGDLDEAAGIVARELSWIRPNEAVCVYADRSKNWLAAIFGVLKAGGVYAPIDPSAPLSVQKANFVRSGARAVLAPSYIPTEQRFFSPRQEQDNTASFQCCVICVDDLLDIQKQSGSVSYPRRRIARPDDLAYICFTSGSTGQPKAVQCTHKGLVAFQKDPVVRLSASRGIVIAQLMSPVFDGSIHEIFSALTHGATLRLVSPSDQDDPFSHLKDSDSAILTPSIAKALDPDHYPRLKNVYLVGEAVPQSVCDTWARNRSLYNMYGPTETTCGATIKRLLPNKPVTLGRPNPSSRVYILDRNHDLLPPGAVGELCIAGIQVSHGYINMTELNAKHFLDDPIMPGAGQKMYKTGDYAYWDSATGEICIIGRKDRQIKLHGFRLDLDDLEVRVTKAIPGCRGATIFRRDDYLVVAYYASSTNAIGALDVKELVADVLPPYAMPRKIFALDEFPLTMAGKLDYKAIERKVDMMATDQSVDTRPQKIILSSTEQLVVGAVRDLMKLDSGVPIDRNSDLTTLGSHSLLQLQLASRISSLTQRRFTIRKVIENPVISRLASVIDDMMREERVVGVGKRRHHGQNGTRALGDSQISPIERDWFLKYQRNLGTTSFNVCHVSELSVEFHQHPTLVSAWNTVLARHIILRCRFRPSATDGSVVRSYAADPPKALYVESLNIRDVINTEFSLGAEDPIRVIISKRYMAVCVSHIICDYTTLACLFKELATAYANVNSPVKSPLMAPEKRYQDTTCWNLDIDQATVNFWKSYLSGINFARIPPYMKAPRTSYDGSSLLFLLSRNTMSSLETVSRSLGLTLHQIGLAIVSLVLHADKPTKQDLLLGSPYLGRQEEDMCAIGLFLQPLPIRIPRLVDRGKDNSREATLASFLLAVRESARSALSHSIEWNSLIKILSTSDDEGLRAAAATEAPNHPLFDAVVSFHEMSTAEPSSSIHNIIPSQPLVTWAEGSKFGIMFEFTAVSPSSVTLRIEYDTSLFSEEEVWLFAARVDAGFRYMCQSPSSIEVGELESRLLGVGSGDNVRAGQSSEGIKNLGFGIALSDLK